ncbi:MAG: hypothetical protein IJS65_04310 [Clostridia bacterium]|nr:hypothetical protein [Clostridia bacterium]
MKTAVFILDGAADEPNARLSGKTPLETAFHHNMDLFASYGAFGTLPAFSEAASLGLDFPAAAGAGAYFAAKAAGASLGENDLAYFCATVTLSDAERFEDAVMQDIGAYGTEGFRSRDALNLLKGATDAEIREGRGYTHTLVLRDSLSGGTQTPPEKVLGKRVGDFLPRGRNEKALCDLMRLSYGKLRGCFKNEGEGSPVSAVWLWGEAKSFSSPSFKELFGVPRAALIAESDRYYGAGAQLGLDLIEVPSANGRYDTNYDKIALAAKNAFDTGEDIVFICAEGARESSLRGEIRNKIYAVEKFDELCIGPVMHYLENKGEDFTALCLSGRAASVEKKEIIDIPTPFAFYKSVSHPTHKTRFNEKCAIDTGVSESAPSALLKKALKKR